MIGCGESVLIGLFSLLTVEDIYPRHAPVQTDTRALASIPLGQGGVTSKRVVNKSVALDPWSVGLALSL